MTTGDLRPDEAADPAEFVDLLRHLKDRSRLTFRQLEQHAVAAGDVLARSTAADVLRRSTLPRPEVLAAFVRACGAGDQVDEWLRARDRLAAGAYAAPAAPATAPTPSGASAGDVLTGGPDEARSRWFARPAPLATLLAVAVLAAFGAWFLWPDDDEQRTAEKPAATSTATPGASASAGGNGTPPPVAEAGSVPPAHRSSASARGATAAAATTIPWRCSGPAPAPPHRRPTWCRSPTTSTSSSGTIRSTGWAASPSGGRIPVAT